MQDWHPTACADVYCTDNDDIVPLDATWPADLPLLAVIIERPGVLLTCLARKNKFNTGVVLGISEDKSDLEKCIYRSSNMMSKFGNCYLVALARLVANLNLTLEAFIAGPLNK